MRVKGWKGRRSDHSCSESDNRVSVLSVYLSGYLPPKGRPCFDVWRYSVVALLIPGNYLLLISDNSDGFQEFYDLLSGLSAQ